MHVGITGSYKPDRNSAERWPLRGSFDEFAVACRAIGASLANDRAVLVVGSDGDSTADRHAVEGYVAHGAGSGSILVVRPRGKAGRPDSVVPFLATHKKHPRLFTYLEATES